MHKHSDASRCLIFAAKVVCYVVYGLAAILFAMDALERFKKGDTTEQVKDSSQLGRHELLKSGDKISIAIGGFAVFGLVAVMPWQLVQVLDDIEARTKRSLVRNGMQTCFGSLLFVGAVLVEYASVNGDRLLGWLITNNDWLGGLKNVLAGFAGLLMLIGAWIAIVGTLGFFEYVACYLNCEKEASPSKPENMPTDKASA